MTITKHRFDIFAGLTMPKPPKQHGSVSKLLSVSLGGAQPIRADKNEHELLAPDRVGILSSISDMVLAMYVHLLTQ